MEAVVLILALLLQPPQAHGKTKVHHRTYHGGEVHEAETDGTTDGIVIWKNGTMQEMHNGQLGKWFPVHPPKEGKPIQPPDEPQLPVPDLPDAAADAATAIIDDYVMNKWIKDPEGQFLVFKETIETVLLPPYGIALLKQ